MIKIAHRGNTEGPCPDWENSPSYINEAYEAGFSVEVDVWGIHGRLWLGHDTPQYHIDPEFFADRDNRFFCHCKNIQAIGILYHQVHIRIELQDLSYFYHEHDKYTITNKGVVWCYPGSPPPGEGLRSIIVMPEVFFPQEYLLFPNNLPDYLRDYQVYGVCTDYPSLL